MTSPKFPAAGLSRAPNCASVIAAQSTPTGDATAPRGLFTTEKPCDLLPAQPTSRGVPPNVSAGSYDPVNHPSHYTDHPAGIECIQVTEHMNFNLGNAVKYIWRAGLKGDAAQDLAKAEFYIKRELQRIGK